MDIETFRKHCISIKGSSESFPFIDPTVLVFKVLNKMFAYISLEPKDGVFKVCLKCDPEKSVELREQYRGVAASSFKTLRWNVVHLESDVPDKLIKELVTHSVEEVLKKLPRKLREAYCSNPY